MDVWIDGEFSKIIVCRRDIDKNKALEFKQNYRAIVLSLVTFKIFFLSRKETVFSERAKY
jgi:hypothetical protein